MGRPKGSKNKKTLLKEAIEGTEKDLKAVAKKLKGPVKSVYSGEEIDSEIEIEDTEQEKEDKGDAAVRRFEEMKEKRKKDKTFQSPVYKCQICHEEVWSKSEGHMAYCSCKKTFVDATRGYVRCSLVGYRTGKFVEVPIRSGGF